MKTLIAVLALLAAACRQPPASPAAPALRTVTVRVSNEATCAIRVAVHQGGTPLRSLFVESLTTRDVPVQLREEPGISPVEFRVVGTGCAFRDYTIPAPAVAFDGPRVRLIVGSIPTRSTIEIPPQR